MTMMLEDELTDVMGKAWRGSGRSAGELALLTGLSEPQIRAAIEGREQGEVLDRVARVLGVHPGALRGLSTYEPRALRLDCVKQLILPFGDWTVNAWLLDVRGQRVLIDSGCDGDSLCRALGGELPDWVCITHGHRDHVGGLSWLRANQVPCHGWGIDAVDPVEPGPVREVAGVRVRLQDLSGHFTPALAIEFPDLSRPLLAVGDALFAGSIGKCSGPESYAMALRNLSVVLTGLPDETVLLPGHGPATTLGEERKCNPFLAAW